VNSGFFCIYARQLDTDPQAGRTKENIHCRSPEVFVVAESGEMEPGELVGNLADLTFQTTETDPSIHGPT
jgi:hypothetical protein